MRTLPIFLTALLAGCAIVSAPIDRAPARVGGPASSALTDLPAPREQVVAAVYRFRDQTGQYKPSAGASTFSTAVTQGATSILVAALEASGWFVPIEREGLSNLLNERQIIQTTRAQNVGPDGEPLGSLPPLLYAGVLIEGGIVGYDTNLLTGGVGARYFATGGSAQFRQDQVTIYLRAVATQTGRVLKSVHTTKTILSQQVDGSLFRFVDANRLLEAEVGYSFNEPPVVAVTEAIEEAVRTLIIEGVEDGIWGLANEGERAALVAAYRADRDEAQTVDAYGNRRLPPLTGTSVSVDGGAANYQGDLAGVETRPTVGLTVRRHLSPRVALGASGAYGSIAAGGLDVGYLEASLQAAYFPLPRARVSPLVYLGAGGLFVTDDAPGKWALPAAVSGVGLQYRLGGGRLGLALENTYPLVEGIDGTDSGPVHDNLWKARVSLTLGALSF